MTRAIVATATPITEIELMTLMTCVLFLEKIPASYKEWEIHNSILPYLYNGIESELPS